MRKHQLYEQYFKDFMELHPSTNLSLNLDEYKYLNGKYENTHSSIYKQQLHDFAVKYKLLVKNIPMNSRTIYEKMILINCEHQLESEQYGFERIPLSANENEIAYLAEIASGHSSVKLISKEDYINFISCIQELPKIVSSIIVQFKTGIKDNFTLPKKLANELKNQMNSILSEKAWINTGIKVKLSFDFNLTCTDIFEVEVSRLYSFLNSEYVSKCRNTIGLCGLKNGKNIYEFVVKQTLQDKDISIEDIHNFGLFEVNRIHNELIKLQEDFGVKMSLQAFFKYMTNRKDLKFKSKKELLLMYKNQVSENKNHLIESLFFKDVKTKCLVTPVPKFNDEFASDAYYMEGDLKNKTPGQFFINMKYFDTMNKTDIECLTLHETYPGHHYQISLVNENKKIPLFMKIFNVESYVEGWGLYCENLGNYSTAESYYGKLIMELVRAIRLVVDTGIHYYGWSYNKTFNYMKENGNESRSVIDDYIIRYMSIPSQALAYKMGEKCMIECLIKFFNNGGVDLKEFHEKILEDGPITLKLLREKFD